MDIRKQAEQYYNSLYAMPPGPGAMADFAELILNEFVVELEKNMGAVAWNYGCDNVIFVSKSIDNRKSLQEIKKEFIDVVGNKSTEVNTDGERSAGDREEHKET